MIWTGDSARHDNDEKIPRKVEEVLELNEYLVTKFAEVFGKRDRHNDTDPTNDFIIPVVPTFGNNDIMPHNIMEGGPNQWIKKFAHIWRSLIPEAQRHIFQRGGYFFAEVIANKLAVFNLNTLYFYESNGAVDGCGKKSEPGFAQMEWLRVQLQLIRERGMKAIIIGHVPPARTYGKQSWDETCWQKYSLWMRQYRDVVVGSLYGHMNIDHFMLQDFHQIKKKTKKGKLKTIDSLDEDISIQSKKEYLADLRDDWASIPDAPSSQEASMAKKKKHKRKKTYLEKIGGEWAERYSVSLVSASVVPNFFPSFRVVEYNISGLDHTSSSTASPVSEHSTGQYGGLEVNSLDQQPQGDAPRQSKKQADHNKKKKKPRYVVPLPPSKSSPPGPAYSPQTFTFLGYKQYMANLTRINAAASALADSGSQTGIIADDLLRSNGFQYELEYNTVNDSVYGMDDLTVRSWVDLARRIGRYVPNDEFTCEDDDLEDYQLQEQQEESDEQNSVEAAKHKKHKKHKKHRKHKKKKKQSKKEREETERLWFTFLRRAYVSTKGDEELREEFDGV